MLRGPNYPTHCYLCGTKEGCLAFWFLKSTYVCADCCHQTNDPERNEPQTDYLYNITKLLEHVKFQDDRLRPEVFKVIDANRGLLETGGRDAWKKLKQACDIIHIDSSIKRFTSLVRELDTVALDVLDSQTNDQLFILKSFFLLRKELPTRESTLEQLGISTITPQDDRLAEYLKRCEIFHKERDSLIGLCEAKAALEKDGGV